MRDQPVSVSGGCRCGKIWYETDVLLKSGDMCHCHICQKSTRAPAKIKVPIESATLGFITEEPKY
ncbi:MAG: GFA family protein [Gammaproteobacteria bacterium]